MEADLVEQILEAFSIEESDIRTYSPLALAFLGDGVFDLVIRTMVVCRANAPAQTLHDETSHTVKAASQAMLFESIKANLTEEELAIYRRGRNAKPHSVAKNASVHDYRVATGFEAMMGYLYLTGQMTRILELIKMGLEVDDER